MNDVGVVQRSLERTDSGGIPPNAVRNDAATLWWLALAGTLIIVLLTNPLGYIGGGWDDWHYLQATRCWREYGACLPHDHWESRWPVFAPAAAITALFGESRLTLSIWPLIASAACLILLAIVGNRLFSKPTGFVAAMLLVVAPAFSIQILDLRVEAFELACVLGGFLAILEWERDRRWFWPFLAGLSFGLAVQVRETAIIAAVFSAGYVMRRSPRPRLSHIAWALLGIAIPFLIEFAVFTALTGDPFYRRELSLRHTLIPSSELLGPIDPAHSPLFNVNYIANWRRESDIHVHWSIDGLLNLFFNGRAALLFFYVPLVLLAGRALIDPVTRTKAFRLWLLSIGYASVLIYVFAIDPKARMMFVPLALNATAVALLTLGLWDSGRRAIAGSIWASIAAMGLFLLFSHQSTAVIEGPAARWIKAYPGQIEIDPNTRRHLALVPAAASLPPLESDSAYLIYNSTVGCAEWVKLAKLPPNSLTVIDYANISRMGWLKPELTGALCLYRYNQPLPGSVVRAAIRRSRQDGSYVLSQPGK